MFMDRLVGRIGELGSCVAVGLEPDVAGVPGRMKEDIFFSRGKTMEAVSRIVYRFNRAIIDQVCDVVPAVLLQMAMYEQFGVPGVSCYIKTADYARSKGLLVIGDVKRGDFPGAAYAYSGGHIGRVEIDGQVHRVFDEDFITVNPYMGSDAVLPFLEDCRNYGKGIFVVLRTANAGGADIQDLMVESAGSAGVLPLYRYVGEMVDRWGRGMVGKHGFSSVGALVSTASGEEARLLRESMPYTFFLVPEGGSIDGMLNRKGLGALVYCSHSVTEAYQRPAYRSFGETGFAQAARASVLDIASQL